MGNQVSIPIRDYLKFKHTGEDFIALLEKVSIPIRDYLKFKHQ